jgi:hypothetical protein
MAAFLFCGGGVDASYQAEGNFDDDPGGDRFAVGMMGGR